MDQNWIYFEPKSDSKYRNDPHVSPDKFCQLLIKVLSNFVHTNTRFTLEKMYCTFMCLF